MIGFSTVAKLLFCITPPSGCLCVMLEWKKKNERNEIVYFYRTHSDILLCGTARFSRGNKNKLRTFQPQKWEKIKNSQPQTKFTGSYIKKECIYIYWNSWWCTNRCWTLYPVELFKPTFIYNLTLEKKYMQCLRVIFYHCCCCKLLHLPNRLLSANLK